MAKAKRLDEAQFIELLDEVSKTSRRPVVDRAVFMLSFFAGLRAQEIAGLKWVKNLFDAKGKFHTRARRENGEVVRVGVLTVDATITKGGSTYGQEREIEMNPLLEKALRDLWASDERHDEFVIPSGKRGADQSLRSRAHALVVRINRFYDRAGFTATSHSGRRTYLTALTRRANLLGASLRDVQVVAGHADIKTTEGYIDTSETRGRLSSSGPF